MLPGKCFLWAPAPGHTSQGLREPVREQILELGWKIGGGDRSRVSHEQQPLQVFGPITGRCGTRCLSGSAALTWSWLASEVRTNEPHLAVRIWSVRVSPSPGGSGVGHSRRSSLVPGGTPWTRLSPESLLQLSQGVSCRALGQGSRPSGTPVPYSLVQWVFPLSGYWEPLWEQRGQRATGDSRGVATGTVHVALLVSIFPQDHVVTQVFGRCVSECPWNRTSCIICGAPSKSKCRASC